MSSLGQFCDWLANTPVSQTIQDVAWVVPATQTVHILALASVYFLMVVFDLQVMGVLARPPQPDWARRPMPWLWGGLAVLAASGAVLILGEPKRELFSWPFRIKMLLVVVAALLTLVLSRIAHRPGPEPGTRLIAGLVLVCWTLIVICGRWIAYINFGDEEDAGMTLEAAATWLENLALPTAIRESGSLFPIIETLHVFGVALVVGSIATVDLRLLGLARRDEPAWAVAQKALPWTWCAFALAVISGVLMFTSAAVNYVDNPAFAIKLGLLLLAGLNMAIFHVGAGRAMADWAADRTPRGARLAGGLSLAFWIGVVAAGRWIGFADVGPPF